MTQPQDWVTTIGLIAATAAGLCGCIGAASRIVRGRSDRWIEIVSTIAFVVLTFGVFAYRAFSLHDRWMALEAHVDGLTLMAAVLGAATTYLQWTRKLPGVGLFILAVAAIMTLWGVCASWWTMRSFDMPGAWRQLHLASVYIGTMCVALAAAAGAMWLYVDRQLRLKDHRADRFRRLGKLTSLESLETAVTRSATLGFLLLTVALATGVVIISSEARLGEGWWYSPKVVLAAVAWGIFAVVMNVRHVATFRGRRAAVLSIVGFLLLIGVLGIAQALPQGVETTRLNIEVRDTGEAR